MLSIRALVAFAALLLLPVTAASAAPRADLAMKGVTAPAKVAAGGTLAASFEVRTSGRGAPKAATVGFRLSRDGRLDKSDPALGRGTTVRALKARKARRSTVNLTVPASVKPGAYRLFACVDPGARVRERSERNNCAARPLSVVKRGPATPPGPLAGTGGGGPAAAVAAAVAGAVTDAGVSPDAGGSKDDPKPEDPKDPQQHPDFDPTAGDGAAPEPGAIAPPVSSRTSTGLQDSVDFLYKGPNAIQTGVGDGTISEKRIAVLRGRVITRADQALAGVKVTVKDRPELGQTKTQADGGFDMVVNGGGSITLEFERDGYVSAQREVDVPWKDFVELREDVALVRFDASNTAVDLDSATPYQVHQASETSDGDGSRAATLLVEQGTDAEMVLPNGQEVPLDQMTVRATEFTTGENGEEAMPGDLPSTSAYTYAVEMSVDEAVEAGATDVQFTKPVINYTENFLDFPAGEPVPTGYFDREKGEWVPSKDGRVIKILAEGADVDADGAIEAAVDTDGDGLADEGLGIDTAERERLAQLQNAGDSLWRVEMKHFTPWDHNWPYGPPEDAEYPQQEWQKKLPPEKESKCKFLGSIIDCESQRLGEMLPLAGTTSKLAYWSDRVPARGVERALPVPLTGKTVPGSLKEVRLKVTVAGRTHEQTFGPAANQVTEFAWDGKDAYGRQLQGSHPVTVEVGYVYGAKYYPARGDFEASFGRPGLRGSALPMRDGREDVVLWSRWADEVEGTIGVWDARAAGLGGWTLSDHHFYDTERRVVHLGNGEKISLDPTISTFAGSTYAPDVVPDGDGGPATEARLHNLRDVEEAPDGSVLFAEDHGDRAWIRRIAPDGTLSTLAGGGTETFDLEGKLATDVRFSYVQFARLPGGDLVVGDPNRRAVWRMDGETKRLTRFAGNGSSGSGSGNARGVGDGGPATEASFPSIHDVAVGPDGSVYIVDFHQFSRVRRVLPNGMIETFAGTSEYDENDPHDMGDGGPATEANLYGAKEVLPAADGTVYVAQDRQSWDSRGGQVRRIMQDGTITTVAGGKPAAESLGDGFPATEQRLGKIEGIALAPDGSLLMAEEQSSGSSHGKIRRVATDGILSTVAGGKQASPGNGDGGPAPAAHIPSPWDVEVTADGSILVTEGWSGHRIRRIARPFPVSDDGEVTIPSRDGGQLYVFDPDGRHVKTLDGTTQALVRRFAYDGEGRLVKMIDGDGLETVVERTNGIATAVVAPGGQRTKLTVADDWLTGVESPSAEVTQLGYAAGGLLTSQTDPRGGLHTYTYDPKGRLLSDTDPEQGKQTLTRTPLEDGFRLTLSTKLGRAQTTEVRRLADGVLRTEITDRDGSKNVVLARPDGSQTTTYANGMTSEATRAPDPRWDYSVPLLASQVDKTPGGKTRTTAFKRTAQLADRQDPLSLEKLTDTLTVNGKVHTTAYDHAAKTLTRTSAGGRVERTTFDTLGRVTKSEPSGVDPIDYVHDSRGRTESVTQSDQKWTFAYDARDRVETRTNALDQVTRYGYDDSDRVTSVRTPDDKVTRFEYAPGGDMKAIVMPDGKRHVLTHDKRGRLSGFTPFGSESSLTKTFDGDGRTDATTLPGGAVLDNQFDDKQRPAGVVYPEAATSIGYKPGTGLPSSLTRTDAGTGVTDTTSLDFDGDMPTKTTIAPGGTTLATFDQTYGNDLLQTSAKLVSGTTTVTSAITRNDDGLVTGYGPFTLARSGPGGAVSAINDTRMTASFGYDGSGVPNKRSTTVNGIHAFGVDVTFDAAGRVQSRVEKAGATEHTFTYVHDSSGRLKEVKRNGVVVEAYDYDDNGNRTSRRIGEAAAEVATYDGQDRLATRAGKAYEFSASGHLVKRGDDTFSYSARGELLSATVGQTTVQYRYDGMGRRVARIQGNDTTRYLYGNPSDPFEVTGVRSPSGTVTRYFYDEQGLLFAMQRGATRFYIATDQVGTPRAVTDSGGAVVKRLEVDAFGVPVSDSAPSFDLPFGFAGGLADPVTGLVRFGMRDLEPLSGRWTARDPALFDGGQTNLYSYVGNAPVALRDPTGLFCIGGSVYGGFGGGASFCMNSDGDVSVCVEAGLGVGTDVDIDWLGDVAKDGESVIAEVKAKAGPVAIKFGGELDNTGCITGGPEVEFGSVKINPDGVAYKTPIELETSGGPAYIAKAAKLGLSAKVAAKICRAGKI